MSVVVAIAYWRDGGRYPRADLSRRSGDVYLHNTATMVATWQRVSSVEDVSFVLCSNAEPTGPVADQLQRLGVERWEVPFRSVPPDGYFNRFSASTYSLDVLRAFGDRLGTDDVLLLVDPDVVWVRDPTPLVEQTRRSGLVVKEIPFPPDQSDLGLTQAELTDLVAALSGRPVGGPVRRIGGEFLSATKAELHRWVPMCDEAWQASVRRFEQGRSPLLHTEEHVFSHAFEVVGYSPTDSTTDRIRRVWTRPARVRNVRGDEVDFVAWHVLSEKAWGLWDLFDDLVAGRGVFEAGLEGARYRQALARRLGIDRSPRLRVRHAAAIAHARLTNRPIRPMPG